MGFSALTTFFTATDMVLRWFLPPASAVEVIESEPCVCEHFRSYKKDHNLTIVLNEDMDFSVYWEIL